MSQITIHIRNMCCQRCIDAVTDEFRLLGIVATTVKLGEATFDFSYNIELSKIEKALNNRGFILIKNEDEIIVETIKAIILDFIQHLEDVEKKSVNLPSLLEEKTKTPYRTLLKIFRKDKGCTIQKYFILQKIEKTKELIEQTNLNFSEIANMLGYKSLQHLSGQFHKITGETMLNYKNSDSKKRIHIDKV